LNISPAKTPWQLEFFLLAALWGASFLFMRLANTEFGALPTVGVRVAVASLCLLPVLLWQGHGRTLLRHWKQLWVVGMLNSGIPFVCFSFALLSISSGLSSILNATVPLFGALIAWVWLRDRPSGSRMLGLAIGFLGVALLAWDKASFKPDANGLSTGWAILACLLACVCYGISASYTKRHLAGLPTLVTAAGSQLGAALGLALPTWWLWPARMPGHTAWAAVLAVGVFCTGLAYVLFFSLIEKVGPSRAITVTFVVPVFAVIYGVILLGETVTPWMVFCGAIIVCGTALSANLIRLR
jgi:drug/metabolite transporter (DMT)-like permease